MKYIKLLCLTLAISVIIPAIAKKPKDKNKYGVYMTGVSASFTDSLVYFTGIQYIDSAAIGTNGLLLDRSMYSMQLKDYIEQNQNGKNRTCFIYYNQKKKKLQKEVSKLKQRYQKNKSILVLDVNPDFKFEKAGIAE